MAIWYSAPVSTLSLLALIFTVLLKSIVIDVLHLSKASEVLDWSSYVSNE